MNILLLYLMIGPSGAALSVDRLIARYWASWRALRGRRPVPDYLEPRPSVSANFTLRLIQVHLCVIYLVAGLAKLKGPAWWEGTAIWKTMANFEFSPMHFSPYLDFLHFLSNHILLWYIVLTGMAVFTLCMEIGFPILIWVRPMRWVMLTMALLMHTGIALFMGLNTFSLFMLVFLLAFVPLETMQKLLGLLGRGSRPLRLSFNGRSRPQVRAASLVRAVDVWDQVALQEQSGARRGNGAPDGPRSGPALQTVGTLRPEPAMAEALSLELTTEDGQPLRGFAVFERLVYSLRLLWPLVPAAWLLGVTGLGRAWFPGNEIPLTASPSENGKHKGKGEKVPSS
jgi:hypothetical protein